MVGDEFTENTNTGILHPARDHSFENVKLFFKNLKKTAQHGPIFFALFAFCCLWGTLLGTEIWPLVYEGQASFQWPQAEPVLNVASSQDLATAFLNNKNVIAILKSEKDAYKTSRPIFNTIQAELKKSFLPNGILHYFKNHSQSKTPLHRISDALSIEKLQNSYRFTVRDTNPRLAQELYNALPLSVAFLAQKQNLNLTTENYKEGGFFILSTNTYLANRSLVFNFFLFSGTVLALIFAYWVSNSSQLGAKEDLSLAFPFPILGMLPEKDTSLSPTLLNDAYELLRTNVSMQRSIFSFSSLTLIWPFDHSQKNEFLHRIASDYSKTSKKVLVIETSQVNETAYPSPNALGLTDLHYVIKNSVDEEENENSIFWKLYEYVVGTEEKFYYMPFGKAKVAPEILFEKYNFRKILNLLKKHFSLVIFNSPEHVDINQTLPWTTVSDATLIVANYQKHNTVAMKDILKDIACNQRFLLGGVLTEVPVDNSVPAKILSYQELKSIRSVA